MYVHGMNLLTYQAYDNKDNSGSYDYPTEQAESGASCQATTFDIRVGARTYFLLTVDGNIRK